MPRLCRRVQNPDSSSGWGQTLGQVPDDDRIETMTTGSLPTPQRTGCVSHGKTMKTRFPVPSTGARLRARPGTARPFDSDCRGSPVRPASTISPCGIAVGGGAACVLSHGKPGEPQDPVRDRVSVLGGGCSLPPFVRLSRTARASATVLAFISMMVAWWTKAVDGVRIISMPVATTGSRRGYRVRLAGLCVEPTAAIACEQTLETAHSKARTDSSRQAWVRRHSPPFLPFAATDVDGLSSNRRRRIQPAQAPVAGDISGMQSAR